MVLVCRYRRSDRRLWRAAGVRGPRHASGGHVDRLRRRACGERNLLAHAAPTGKWLGLDPAAILPRHRARRAGRLPGHLLQAESARVQAEAGGGRDDARGAIEVARPTLNRLMADDSFPARSAIASSQREQLRRLLAALVPANSFYTQKFSRAGVTATVTDLDEFSEKFPFTTKQELADDQSAQPPYGTNLTFPLERYTRFHQTSGTTGAPLRWLDTPESWRWMVENWIEILRAAGATSGDRVFFAFSFGPFIGFWLAYEAAQRIGCLCLPGGGLSSAARLRVMLDNDATILCCTPTYALRLAEVAAEEWIDLSAASVKTIIVAGEPGGSIPVLRARLQELWHGARVFDHHGMTETGPVTHECPRLPGVLHVLEPAYFAEVIDPSGKPVAPGERGELVLTAPGST